MNELPMSFNHISAVHEMVPIQPYSVAHRLGKKTLADSDERRAVYAKPILPRSHIANLFGTNSKALGGRSARGRSARDRTSGEQWRRSCLLGGRSATFFQILFAAPVRCCYFLWPTL
ncbi:hypothetical protein NE237_023721 [Protea cynaroides]|uniref:Uncharacterized protein n=1 Tax=Protea cynaroides TaxID=273540 RepID=A0A9Q0K5N6_9MAGN|nr:hypothetical protein NE237_023721 [Protea cynaroides]